mmetsp:Transcript_27911/g.61086  ORF Transcript_27911/g.61086 Transcript_27911/m.61086 type:complete len:103 (-) Transcript_27911:247-555(-)
MQQQDVKVQKQDVDWSAVQAWPGSAESLAAVQNLLDRNKLIISEIDANHESQTNECLERNEELIRELNSNINQVVSLYQDLSQTAAKASNGDSVEVETQTSQ